MPIILVRKKGRIIGYKYGDTGKLYRGKGAREKAVKQGRAISISKARQSGHNIPIKTSSMARGHIRTLD